MSEKPRKNKKKKIPLVVDTNESEQIVLLHDYSSSKGLSLLKSVGVLDNVAEVSSLPKEKGIQIHKNILYVTPSNDVSEENDFVLVLSAETIREKIDRLIVDNSSGLITAHDLREVLTAIADDIVLSSSGSWDSSVDTGKLVEFGEDDGLNVLSVSADPNGIYTHFSDVYRKINHIDDHPYYVGDFTEYILRFYSIIPAWGFTENIEDALPLVTSSGVLNDPTQVSWDGKFSITKVKMGTLAGKIIQSDGRGLDALATTNRSDGIPDYLCPPTYDPRVYGVIWNDNGVLKVSAGEV